MDTTIRNLDEDAYRALRAQAALEGRTLGQLLNEAICSYLARGGEKPQKTSLRDLQPEPYPEGNERLSSDIDAVVYGVQR